MRVRVDEGASRSRLCGRRASEWQELKRALGRGSGWWVRFQCGSEGLCRYGGMNERNRDRAAEGTWAVTRGAGGGGGRARGGRGWLRWGLVVLLAGGVGGCASGVAEPRVAATAVASQPVRLTITNEATRAWQLSFLDLDGFEVRQVRLQAREEATVELAGGEYTLEQSLLAASGARESVRRFPLRLKAGGTYNWTLATLLTDATAAVGVGRVATRE